MYRVSLANVSVHRTLTPLYEKHQATPIAVFLDPAETDDIYSGMVMQRTAATTVGLYDGTSAAAIPFGLSALDKNAKINDLDGLDIKPWSVWQGGPDAYFTIKAPAFDDAQSYSVPTNGTRTPLYANAAGQITSVANGVIVAELIEVVSASQLIIRLALPVGFVTTIA